MIQYYKGHNSFEIFNKYKEILNKSIQLYTDINVLSIKENKDNIEKNIMDFFSNSPFLSTKKVIIFYNLSYWGNTELFNFIYQIILKKQNDYIEIYFFEVIEDDKKDVDKRYVLFKYIDKYLVKEYKKLTDYELDIWIKKILKNNNISIDDDASFLLRKLKNNDQWAIKNELDKLILYGAQNIDISIITSIISDAQLISIFELSDAIIKKNIKNIYLSLKKLINQNEEPIAIIRNIQYNFKLMYLLKITENINENIVLKTFNIHPFVFKKNKQYISKYSIDELLKLYNLSIEAEINIRSGNSIDEYFDIISIINNIK